MTELREREWYVTTDFLSIEYNWQNTGQYKPAKYEVSHQFRWSYVLRFLFIITCRKHHLLLNESRKLALFELHFFWIFFRKNIQTHSQIIFFNLKKRLKCASKVSITKNFQKFGQKIQYMVVTRHFVNSDWIYCKYMCWLL